MCPQSVDVHFLFHYRMRMNSVEWFYSIGYRINPEPTAPMNEYTDRASMQRAHRAGGWRPFGWFYLDDNGRRSERSACPITRADLTRVHDALFGSSEKKTLGGKVSLRTTARLLVASVGISFEVAVDAEHAERAKDGYLQSYMDEMYIELESPKPGISAAHLTKICGIQPLEGDGTSDRLFLTVGSMMRYRHGGLDERACLGTFGS